MIILNGLPRTWDSFNQGICARKKLVKFSKLWEEFSQEENMGSEDQALIVKSKKTRIDHHRGKHSCQKNNTRKYNKYLSKFIFYTCDER